MHSESSVEHPPQVLLLHITHWFSQGIADRFRSDHIVLEPDNIRYFLDIWSLEETVTDHLGEGGRENLVNSALLSKVCTQF